MAGWTEADVDARRDQVAGVVRQTKAIGRIRLPKGMNKTELRYSIFLELQRRAGVVVWFRYEGMTLKMGYDLRYTPDFIVMMASGAIQFHEVKGAKKDGKPHVQDDARAKIAMAAELYPFEFLMVWPGTRGEWESKYF